MAQVYKKLEIDVNNKIVDIITAVQNDAGSRYLDVVLLDGSTAINLTGHEVRIYGKKYDGTEFYNNGTITNAPGGRCQFELTSQALVVANDLTVQIVIFENNVEILSTQPFIVHVVKSLMSDAAIESSNEYEALVVLYQNLYEAYDLMTEMVQKIGVPMDRAQSLNLDTMFKVWDYLIVYLETNSSASVVSTVNEINSKIGTNWDTAGTTVMGKLNALGVVKSAQRGTIVGKSEDTTIMINSVDVNRTMVLLNGIYCFVSGGHAYPCFLKSLTSTSLVISAVITGSNSKNWFPVSWQVVEYY